MHFNILDTIHMLSLGIWKVKSEVRCAVSAKYTGFRRFIQKRRLNVSLIFIWLNTDNILDVLGHK